MSDVKGRIAELNQHLEMLARDLKKTKVELRPIPPAPEWNLGQFRKELTFFMELDRSSALEKITNGLVNRVTLYPDRIDVSPFLVCDDGKGSKLNARQQGTRKNKINKKSALGQVQSQFRGCKS